MLGAAFSKFSGRAAQHDEGRAVPPILSHMKAVRYLVLALGALVLQACATLPTNAPTAGQIERRANAPESSLNFDIIDIDAATAIATPGVNAGGLIQLEALSAIGPVSTADTIHVGDRLAIQVFEVGIALFAGQTTNLAGNQTPVANAQRFEVEVKQAGTISLPYLGTVKAEGSSPEQLALDIRNRLRSLSESPEVLVTISESVENVAYVTGSVSRPGRIRLSLARERLLDLLALAGGARIEPEDAELRIVRGDKTASVGLNVLHPEDLANIVVSPGDRIEVLRRRKSFTVFGATDSVSQINFDSDRVSLAEAVARGSGPSDSRANPRGVFLFRLARGDNDDVVKPIVYRLNMMNSESYFLAQMFQVQDKDVILFANADANMSAKFINVLNQLFSPLLTARVLAN